MVRIETDRLNIREMRKADQIPLHVLRSDSEIMNFLPWRDNTHEQTRQYFKNCFDEIFRQDRQYYAFTLELKENNEIMGEVAFTVAGKNEFGGIADIELYLFKVYQQKGYGSEAIRAIIEYCIERLGIHKIIARCDSDHKKYIAVLEKIGFHQEAILKKHFYNRSAWRDLVYFALFKDQWKLEKSVIHLIES
jgi:RimJ/RimL family protein N-acetyltransferase